MGSTRIFELGDREGARRRALEDKKIVVIGLSTEENYIYWVAQKSKPLSLIIIKSY